MPTRSPRSRGRLARSFYDRPTLEVARDLLGKVLVHGVGTRLASGLIVEVEAYIGEADPACHASPGPTRRNAPLYGEPGIAYVYLNYGIHCLMNVVTERAGTPAAVLIRALEPLEGLALMRRRRTRGVPDVALCRGPGNLAQALAITLRQNRADLCHTSLTVEDHGHGIGRIAWTPRIGIRVGTERPWRAYVVGSKAVSGHRQRATSDEQ